MTVTEAGAPDVTRSAGATDHRNEVVLVGRLAATAEERELPSGDVITVWRLVVDRPAGRGKQRQGTQPAVGQRSSTVDTLDCVAWTAGLRRTVRSLKPGDLVLVTGALRRRFWRAGAATVSRYEVEVGTVKRLQKARKPK